MLYAPSLFDPKLVIAVSHLAVADVTVSLSGLKSRTLKQDHLKIRLTIS